MNLSENLQIQADKYLDNVLSEVEKNAFKIELSSNIELQEYIAINKEMRNQFSDNDWQFVKTEKSQNAEELEQFFKNEEAKDLKLTLEKVSSQYRATQNTSSTINLKRYSFLAVAASIALLVGLFFFNKDKNLYQDYNSWQELPSLIERGEEQSKVLQEAENAFVNKDYVTANKLYKQYLTETNSTNSNIYLYLGITQLELNESKNALSTFDKVIKSNSIDFSKGYWYKGLVYLKNNDKINAIKQFENSVSNSENYKFTEAKNLLEKLKN